jgi:heme/copper-type cytochrome/quinol oxidase subunit 3
MYNTILLVCEAAFVIWAIYAGIKALKTSKKRGISIIVIAILLACLFVVQLTTGL